MNQPRQIVAICVAILAVCSPCDAGFWRCQVRLKQKDNRAAVIAQGVPKLRATAAVNRSYALRNFSTPFNIWGWIPLPWK